MKRLGFLETMSMILGAAAIVVSIFVFILEGAPALHMLRDGERVSAVVTDAIRESNDGEEMYRAIYSYHFDGESYEVQGSGTSSSPAAVGTETIVYVDPKNPAKAKTAINLIMMLFVPAFVMTIGVFFFSIFVGGITGMLKYQGSPDAASFTMTEGNAIIRKITSARSIGFAFIGEAIFFMFFFTAIGILAPETKLISFQSFGFLLIFLIIGILFVKFEARFYRGRRKKSVNVETRRFTNQAQMISDALRELNHDGSSYAITSDGQNRIKIGIKWMDGIYLGASMSVRRASSYFSHIVFLDEKTKTYSGMDYYTESEFQASMLHISGGINYKTGIVHERIFVEALGFDKTTGEKGLIRSTLNTDELRGILDDFVESYGYTRKA